MAGKTMAPTLPRIVDAYERTLAPGSSAVREARRELHALRAVARSLGRVKRHAWNGPWETEIHRAFDAHDRLERLSSRGSTALPRSPRGRGRGGA